MGKLTGKIRNTATQMYADKRFDSSEIMKQSYSEHNGEPMMRIYQKIMTDPAISQQETNRPGRYDLVYNADGREAVVGWMDQERGMGEISQKAYDHVHGVAEDGCYIVREKDAYAVKVYTDNMQGLYIKDGQEECTFSDTEKTVFETYEDAMAVSQKAVVQLGLVPTYEEFESYLDDMPHSAEEGDGIYATHDDTEDSATTESDYEIGD